MLRLKILDGDKYRLVCDWAEDGYPPQRGLKILDGDKYRLVCDWAEDGYPPQRKLLMGIHIAWFVVGWRMDILRSENY